MHDTIDLQSIAEAVKAAQDACHSIELLTSQPEGFGQAEAYAVAELIHNMRLQEGWQPVGRKIGFTNPKMWSIYGVQAPIWGFIYDTTTVQLQEQQYTCQLGRFAEPRIEPEVVVRFASEPPLTDDPARILQNIDWIAHGIEIVQSHFPGWKFQAADTIADWALHAKLLVGKPIAVNQLGPDVLSDLESFSVSLSCNGQVQDEGRGANALGSPLKAVAHLIAVLAKQPDSKPLQAGEIVTTGTLTAALPVQPGQRWETTLEGIDLPGISVAFTA